MTNYYLAIDLGASSGRHIVGYKDAKGKIVLKEIFRFKTGMDNSPDDLVWDLNRIFEQIKLGIKKAFEKYKNIVSLSIDTWGVDYVLLENNQAIPPYYAYRNRRNELASAYVNKIIPFEELYKISGIQYAPFNTIYQLYADKLAKRLNQNTEYLMLPCYFTYLLTGKKVHEYTNESTTSLLNARTGKYSKTLIEKLDLPKSMFKDIKLPGEEVGELTPEMQKELKGNCKVVLCASHDTASAFEAIDVPSDGVIISSGTWSLLGIKSPYPIINEKAVKSNYTNEGGVGYIRFLKNIMGMWIGNQVKEQDQLTQEMIDEHIDEVDYKVTFDVNDKSLLAPSNMKGALMNLLDKCPPRNDYELFGSIYRSMAKCYNESINELEQITGNKYSSIYIVGGGAKNKFLNRMVEEYTNRKVVALPIEATALGNIKVQMKARKEL